MIDLETLDTKPTSVVLSIGAVLFTDKIHTDFYTELNIQTQMNRARTMSADTIEWWLNQTSGRSFTLPKEHHVDSLVKFNKWLENELPIHANGQKLKAWGNGSNFDISIMENLLEQSQLKIPWTFGGIRDLRTFKEYVGKNEKIETCGSKHNALDDARAQALYVIKHTGGMK